MENVGYVMLSRQAGLRRQMEVIANNLANANTTAFKSESMMFEEYLSRRAGDVSFTNDRATVQNFTPGEFTPTGNPLDVAVHGDGFLVVETPVGEALTRNGRLGLDLDRQIVADGGLPVLNDAGVPIIVPDDAGFLTIAADGTVSTDDGPIGRLQLVRVENPHQLTRMGGSLYLAGDDPMEDAPESRVVQGMLEMSNVEPILQVTDLIDVHRAYQATSSFIEKEDERVRSAIETLTRAAA